MFSKTPSKNQKNSKKNASSPQLKIVEVQSSLTQLLTMQKILAKQIQQMDYDEPGQAIRNKISCLCLKSSSIKQDYLNLKKDVQKDLKLGFTDIKKVIQSGFSFLTDKVNQKNSNKQMNICQIQPFTKKNSTKEQLQHFYENIKQKCALKQDAMSNTNYQSSPIKMLIAQNYKLIDKQNSIQKTQQTMQQCYSNKEQLKDLIKNFPAATPIKDKRSPSLPKPLRKYPSTNSLSIKQEPIKNNDLLNKENIHKPSRESHEFQNTQFTSSKLSTIRQLINTGNKVQINQKNILKEYISQYPIKKNMTGITFTFQNGCKAIDIAKINEDGSNQKQRKNILMSGPMSHEQNRQSSQQKAPIRQRSTKKIKVFSRI